MTEKEAFKLVMDTLSEVKKTLPDAGEMFDKELAKLGLENSYHGAKLTETEKQIVARMITISNLQALSFVALIAKLKSKGFF